MRLRRSDQDGAVVVEFAAVFVLFMMLLWGIISYGVIFAAQQTVTHAAAEAARATVGQPDESTARSVGMSVATEQMDWLGAGEADSRIEMDITFPECPPDHEGNPVDTTCVRVDITYPWDGDHQIIKPLFDIAVPDSVSSTAVMTWDGL